MGAPLTMVEKIATRFAVGLAPGQPHRVVKQRDFVTIRPKHVMTHDNRVRTYGMGGKASTMDVAKEVAKHAQ